MLFWVHLVPPQPIAHREVSHILALRFSVDSTSSEDFTLSHLDFYIKAPTAEWVINDVLHTQCVPWGPEVGKTVSSRSAWVPCYRSTMKVPIDNSGHSPLLVQAGLGLWKNTWNSSFRRLVLLSPYSGQNWNKTKNSVSQRCLCCLFPRRQCSPLYKNLLSPRVIQPLLQHTPQVRLVHSGFYHTDF